MIKKVLGFVAIFCLCVVFAQNGAGFTSAGIYYSASAAAAAGSSFVYDGPVGQTIATSTSPVTSPTNAVQVGAAVVHANCSIDAEGYDCAGYDSYGYDREGYNVAGYNASSYDREGYNPAGYSVYGYDREGYDVHGYDANGYDREGYNVHGN